MMDNASTSSITHFIWLQRAIDESQEMEQPAQRDPNEDSRDYGYPSRTVTHFKKEDERNGRSCKSQRTDLFPAEAKEY
jgi:hypothetical protein